MGTKRKNSVHIGINLSEDEREILELYVLQENRTKSDVIRELIRSLKGKLRYAVNTEPQKPTND